MLGDCTPLILSDDVAQDRGYTKSNGRTGSRLQLPEYVRIDRYLTTNFKPKGSNYARRELANTLKTMLWFHHNVKFSG